MPPAWRQNSPPVPQFRKIEGRGGEGPDEVPPELGAESEAEEGKVKRGCLQISSAAPRLCRAWGLLHSGQAPLGHLEGCSPDPIYGSKSRFLAGRRRNSTRPLQREPFKIPEPQRCGQLLLGNVVSRRATSPALHPWPGTLAKLGTAGRPGPGVERRSDIFCPVAPREDQASLLVFFFFTCQKGGSTYLWGWGEGEMKSCMEKCKSH